MANKKDDMVVRYLPKLEDKIDSVYDKIIVDNSSLSLSSEESTEVKRMVKFLLSKEVADNAVKRFNINRIRKGLSNADKRGQEKAKFVLQLLNALNEKNLSAEIVNGMPVSSMVIDMVFNPKLNEPDNNKRIEYLSNILQELDKIDDDLRAIRKYVHELNRKAVIHTFKTSTLKEVFMRFNTALSNRSSYGFNDNYLWYDIDKILVYSGDLERKLFNVTESTWNSIKNNKDMNNVICFYIPKSSVNKIGLSQEPKKYVCKTFKEVVDIVKKERKGIR